MIDIDALIERVKAATGPDRELDRSLSDVFGWHKWQQQSQYAGIGSMVQRKSPRDYTSDLNTTRAVAREKGWLVGSSDWHSGGGFLCDIWTKGDNPADVTGRHEHSEPLACCLALLMAIWTVRETEGPDGDSGQRARAALAQGEK